MGSAALPPFSWAEAVSRWQFAPVVTVVTAVLAGLYLWGVVRVARRHPQRPWPVLRTVSFLLGLLVMVAPPLLVMGQPVTLMMHASRNPVHTWVKRIVRSGPVAGLTWPAFGVAAYAATIVGTHLTSFMNLVESSQ